MIFENATIFIVDDDPSVLKGLKRLFKSKGYDVGTFASAQNFLRSNPSRKGPACLVLDMKMPGLSGLEMQEKLDQGEYDVPIVFLTGHGDIPMSVKAMKKGAIDFLSKPVDESDLLVAVEEALQKAAENLARQEENRHIKNLTQSLTPREYEILTYVITGLLNKQIAYALDISEKTVKVHRGRVMQKMNVDSVAELVRLAEKAGVKPAEVSL